MIVSYRNHNEGNHMSVNVKRLKLISIATMFVGIIVTILGIVLAVRSPEVASFLIIASGIIGAVVGVRGSLAANVPSNASKIEGPALLFGLVCMVLGTICVFIKPNDLLALIASMLPGIAGAFVSFAARMVKNDLEQA